MDKKTVLIILTAATLGCFLFLPYVAYRSQSVSMFRILTEGDISQMFDNAIYGIGLLAVIGGMVAALYFAITDNKGSVKTSAWVTIIGYILIVISLFVAANEFGRASDDIMEQIFELFGAGFWLGLAGAIATVVVAKKAVASNYNNNNYNSNNGGNGASFM